MTATLTSKGQITIPKAIRDRLGLRQGDRIEFASDRGTTTIHKFLPEGENPFLAQIGILPTQAGSSVERQREMRGWDEWDRRHFAAKPGRKPGRKS